MSNKAAILKVLDCTEVALFDCLAEVHATQIERCKIHLPQHLNAVFDEVMKRSVAFRNWFVHEVDINDGCFLEFAAQFSNDKRFTLNQYRQMQNLYFEERKVFPSKAVMELCIQEFKNRVSQVDPIFLLK